MMLVVLSMSIKLT